MYKAMCYLGMNSCGSKWRGWNLDLRTTSPDNYKDKTVTNENIIKKLVGSSVSVVTFTD